MTTPIDRDLRLTRFASDAAGGVRANLATLLLYGLLFLVVSALVFTPLRALAIRMLIEGSGRPAISNTDIAAFLLTPTGLAWLLVFAATGLVLLLAQLAGYLLIAQASARGWRIGPAHTLFLTIAALPRLLGMAALQTLIVLASALPFLAAAGLVYLLLLGGQDINYFLADRPPRFLAAVAIGGLLVLGLAVALLVLFARWSLALPVCIVERRTWMAPLTESWRRTRGETWRIGLLLLAWLAAASLISTAVIAAFIWSGEALLAALPQRIGPIIAVTALLAASIDPLIMLLTFLAAAAYAFLVSRLYVLLAGSAARLPDLLEALARETPDPAGWLYSRRLWIGAGALTLAVSSIGFAYAVVEALDIQDRVEITAHRGSSAKAPENSLSAIVQAIDDGADYAEIDVQETADGVVVLLHDTDLKRVAGLDKPIWQASYDEIRGLDAGSWFSPEFKGEPIPTLSQAIEAARGRIKLNIELKLNGHDKRLAERVVEIVRRERFEKDCVLTSLDLEALQEVERLDPALRTGAIVSVAVGDMTRLEVDFLSLLAKLATERTIAAAQGRKLGVHVWTVNEPAAMLRMMHRGVDNIITDRPEVLAELLQKYDALGDVERLLLRFGNWVRAR